MKNAWSLGMSLAATFLSSSICTINADTLKSPNQRFILNARQAMIVVEAAAAKAATNRAPSTIVVVDPYGYPIAILRMDNAYLESVDTCIRKARTVSLFNGGLSTAELQPLVQPGAEIYGIESTNGGMVAIPGALPLLINGTFYAAVSVCGGTSLQDIEAATAGILAVNSTIKL